MKFIIRTNGKPGSCARDSSKAWSKSWVTSEQHVFRNYGNSAAWSADRRDSLLKPWYWRRNLF